MLTKSKSDEICFIKLRIVLQLINNPLNCLPAISCKLYSKNNELQTIR